LGHAGTHFENPPAGRAHAERCGGYGKRRARHGFVGRGRVSGQSVSRTADSVLAPVVVVPGQVGAAARQPQNGDANNRESGVPPPGERRFVAREVVVGLASDLSASTLDDLARRHGLTHLEPLVGTTYHRWRIGDGRSVSDVIRALEADGVVRTAQPNYNFSLAESSQSVGRVSPRNTRRANFTSPKRTASRPAGAARRDCPGKNPHTNKWSAAGCWRPPRSAQAV
jgi:hypothetical protein